MLICRDWVAVAVIIVCMLVITRLVIVIATIGINWGIIIATWLFSVSRVAATAVVVTARIGGAVVVVVSGVAGGVAVILGRVGVARWCDGIYIPTTAAVVLRVEFLLQNQELFTIFLLDSSKGVDIVLELCPSGLLPLGISQPPPETLDQLVVGDPAPTCQH